MADIAGDTNDPNNDHQHDDHDDGGGGAGEDGIALCASCDRCRARKTKCDGERPCSNCAAKYLKKHKLSRYVHVRTE